MAGGVLIAGGVLLVAAVPFTVAVLVGFSDWFRSFFYGPAILWPVLGTLADGYLGFRAIRNGRSARLGRPPGSHGTIMRGYLGIAGAGPLLGGLVGFLGGALLVAAGLMFSREEALFEAQLPPSREDFDDG